MSTDKLKKAPPASAKMFRSVFISVLVLSVFSDRPARDCSDGNQADYRGDTSQTWSGITCQKWTSHRPHNHDYDPTEWPEAGIGFHNNCRNPSGLGRRAWCYTTDPDLRWDYCDVPRCNPPEVKDPECSSGNQADYRGTMSITNSGFTCQNWLKKEPHEPDYNYIEDSSTGIGDHNYCRNPHNEDTGTWCYTVDDPDDDWDYCAVPRC